MPPEAQAEVTAIATSPVVQAVAPEAGQMEVDTAGGSPAVVAVVERTSRRSPLALLSGGSRSLARGEPLLQWMAAEDPTSALFSLDDAAESMERENLDIGFSAMMDALSQASGVLHEILVPTGRVSA